MSKFASKVKHGKVIKARNNFGYVIECLLNLFSLVLTCLNSHNICFPFLLSSKLYIFYML